jgi:hypothetical protein
MNQTPTGSGHVSAALTHDTSSPCRAEPLFGAMFVMFGESSFFEDVKRTMRFGGIPYQPERSVSRTCLSAFVVCLVFLLLLYIIRFIEKYIQGVKLVSH